MGIEAEALLDESLRHLDGGIALQDDGSGKDADGSLVVFVDVQGVVSYPISECWLLLTL